jgi:sec-independent protein translocase protein TatA
MGSFSVWHWLIVLAIILLLFGRGKIPELMGDFAKGIRNFKKGMSDDDSATASSDAKALPQDASTRAGSAEPARSEKS